MNTLIIPAAWDPQNILFPWVYDLMVPVNGKPTINYILENVKKWNISKVIVLLNKNDTKTLQYLQFLNFWDVQILYDAIESSSLSETLTFAQKYLGNDESIIIQLWDTILTEDLVFQKDFISVSRKKVSNPKKWTFIDDEFNIWDKQSQINDDAYLVNGVYFIKNSTKFLQLLQENNSFYHSLESYFKKSDAVLVEHNNGYYDLWHLDEYYKSKIDFLRVRSFNSLKYDDFRSILTKSSSNKEKLAWEINWFKNLPNDLKNFTPRLVDYKEGTDTEYSLEFYGYTSLADIFLYGEYEASHLENVLEKIFHYISYVQENYNDKNFPIKHFYDIYLDKTFERVEKLLQNDFLEQIYNMDYIIINWKQYDNIKNILDKEYLTNFVNEYIYNPNDCTIIHGDLCFSNILFDMNSGIFKLIDPRWKFWEIGIWGDIKYDIAKFRHSVHGRYENIISDLFNLQYSIHEKSFDFDYFNVSDRGEIIKY